MNPRIVWPITALLGLAVVVLGWSHLSAQRLPERPLAFMAGPQVGRFVVAHALAERIVILDTATGQLYVAGERDMKRFTELPRLSEGRPPFMDKEGDGPPARDKFKSDFGRFRDKRKGDKEKESDEKKEKKILNRGNTVDSL